MPLGSVWETYPSSDPVEPEGRIRKPANIIINQSDTLYILSKLFAYDMSSNCRYNTVTVNIS